MVVFILLVIGPVEIAGVKLVAVKAYNLPKKVSITKLTSGSRCRCISSPSLQGQWK